MGPSDTFLLGTDLVKSPSILVPAYDDSRGVTAAFNRNVLSVINRQLDADFAVDEFEHVAIWDEANEWIEMRLRASRAMAVRIRVLEMTVSFDEGEEIRTEISAKFRREGLREEMAQAGFVERQWWTDSKDRFALSLWQPVG
jgi:L-histidine N-alpha-methyltransferase